MDLLEIIVLTLIAAFISSLAQFCYKKSASKRVNSARDMLRLIMDRGVLAGLILYAAGLGVYLLALSGGKLSVVYPAFASSFIFVTIVSAWKFKEKITPMMLLGMLLVFLGIALVAV